MRAMRRTDREKDVNFAWEVIDRSSYATMATVNMDGTPYCVGLSVVRSGNVLYFHCAKEGQKVENLRQSPRVCLFFACDVHPTRFTCEYDSALVTGTAHEVQESEEKVFAMRLICQHFTPDYMDHFDRSMGASAQKLMIWRIDIDSITGKQNKLKQD